MGALAETGRAQHLRVAAVWGTTVVALRDLARGESFALGDGPDCVLPVPEGMSLPSVVLKGSASGFEVDPRGAKNGIVRLRGREEEASSLAAVGAPVPILPGDFGLLQYGLLSVFFQYTAPAPRITAGYRPELLVALALVSSTVFHVGMLGLVRALMTPPPIDKPIELTSPEELAARFGLKRPIQTEEPPAPAVGDKQASSGVKNPGAEDTKKQGGGQKMKGAEGKLGLRGDQKSTELPGEVKPSTQLGGLSEVLQSEAGQEIKNTLKSIETVSNALGGLNSANIVLGGGSGSALKGTGPGGGGTGAGVVFGSGTLDTGWGAGSGGGLGGGRGGPGGRGSGGPGGGGAGGRGAGAGTGVGEARVAVSSGAPSARGGLSPEQIRRVVEAHKGALRACYETEAQRNPNLRGGVTVAWQIEPGGNVSGASIASSTLSNPRVEGCVLRQVKSWRFPVADSSTQVASYPFKFGVGG